MRITLFEPTDKRELIEWTSVEDDVALSLSESGTLTPDAEKEEVGVNVAIELGSDFLQLTGTFRR